MLETYRKPRVSAYFTADYLAWSNSYGRLLRQLGGPAKAGTQERTLADKLAERANVR